MGYTNEIQAARYNELLHRLLDMKEGAPAPVLMPEMTASIILENDPPEYQLLKGVRICKGGLHVPNGGAGTFAQIQLLNPANSGIVSVVTNVSIRTNTAQLIEVRQTQISLLTLSAQRGVIDFRNLTGAGTPILPATQVRSDTPISTVGVILSELYAQANVLLQLEESHYVLGPNSSIKFACATANTTIAVSFDWYERALASSELRRG